jgi:hypothetical protein
MHPLLKPAGDGGTVLKSGSKLRIAYSPAGKLISARPSCPGLVAAQPRTHCMGGGPLVVSLNTHSINC